MTLFISALLLYFIPDTSGIKIHLELEGLSVNTVRYFIPNNYFFNGLDNPNYRDLCGGKIFDFNVPLSKSSFIELRFNNESYIPIAASPGDSISIQINRTQQNEYPIYQYHIAGNNAKAHNIYLERFYPARKTMAFFDDLPKRSKNYSEYYLKTKAYIDSVTYIWDSLMKKEEIDPQIYELYMADTKGVLYDVAIRRMSLLKTADSGWVNYTKWLNIKNVMFYRSDAANIIHLRTLGGAFLYQTYLRNILKEDDAINDTLLKKSDLGIHYYYDTAYREEAWGQELSALKEMFPTSTSPSNKYDLEAFKRYYPESIYFKKVKQFEDSLIADRRSIPEKVNIQTKNYDRVRDIFKSIDSRYFFIDVWATWCLPCIQEFNYHTRLSKFLSNKGIKEIFLSVDKQIELEKWKNFINEQHLSGYHFLVNDKVQGELLNILSKNKNEGSFYIPRYLFYDKKLDEFSIDLPRPSTGIVLENVLNSILEKGESKNLHSR